MNEIVDSLNTLRLYGFKEALEYRLSDASEGNLGHREFLQSLLEDEVIYRKNKLSERLRKRAKFRDFVNLEDFEASRERGLTKTTLKGLSGLYFLERVQNLIFIGGTGAGKTFLAQGLGHLCCREGHEVYFSSVNLLFEEVAAQKAAGKYLDFIKKLKRAKVLVLDDFGLRKYTHQEANALYDILEERYNKGPVIVTSQVRPLGWKSLFEDEVIAEAILDRLISNSQEFLITGPSFRKKQGGIGVKNS